MRGFVEMAEYQRVCEERDDWKFRAEEAEELRSSAGRDARIGAVQGAFRLTRCEAIIVVALYDSKRVLGYEALDRLIPPRMGEERLTPNIPVWVHRIRARLGRDLIENVRGTGYRLSPDAVGRIGAILSEVAPDSHFKALGGEG